MTTTVQILDSYYLPRFGVEDEQQRVYLGKLLDNIHAILEEILATTPAPDSAKYLLYDTPPATLPNAAKLVGSSSITMTPSSGLETLAVAASGVAASTYGDSTHVPQFTVLADGRITAASNIAISSSGTVTSVALTVPTEFSVAGSPITTSGTLAVTKAVQNANLVYAGPTTGAAAQPTFRALVSADLPAGVGTVTSVGGTSPIASSGGTTPVISIADAAADATTKGAATFTAADFNSSSGLISIDYTNGQAADASHKGFLTSADWTAFNNKGSGTVTTTGSPANGNLTKFSGAASVTNGDLSGVVTTSGSLVTSFATQADQTLLANYSGGTAAPSATTADTAKIQRTYYASSTSGTTTYTATLTPVPTAYITGAQYVFTASNTNTGAVTMNFNSLGAKTLQLNGAAIVPGQLQASVTYQSIYDGTNLQITGQSTSVTQIDDGANQSVVADDFLFNPLAAVANTTTVGPQSTTKATGIASGAGHSASSTTSAGMVGVVSLSTGSTNTGSAIVQASTTGVESGQWYIANGQLESISWFKTDTNLSTSGDRYFIVAGLVNGNSLTPQGSTDAIQAFYRDDVNSGKFQILVKVASVNQAVATGTTLFAINTKYVVKLIVNAAGTQVDMYITTYGTPFPASPEATYTGTMPATSVAFSTQIGISKSSGTNSRAVHADRWQMINHLSR